MSELENFLKSYGRYIVKQARKILAKKDKNTTGNLSKSLRYKLVKDTDGFSIQFIANKYGKFVSKGVRVQR